LVVENGLPSETNETHNVTENKISPVPNTDFTRSYMEYASEVTDAPGCFHLALSYVILSSIVAKNAYIPYGGIDMYTNLYVLIAAPSTIHRKSWSIRMALKLVSAIRSEFIMPDCSSVKSFLEELADEERTPPESGLIDIDELGGFMKSVRSNQHKYGLTEALTSAYTQREIYIKTGTKRTDAEKFRIKEPFINIAAACSLDWLTQEVESSDITGGFLARFLWILHTDRNNSPQPLPNRPNLAKEMALIAKLQRISQFIGPIQLVKGGEAHKTYNAWYQEFVAKHQGKRFDVIYNRLTDITLKISALNCLQRLEKEGRQLSSLKEAEIAPGDVQRAILLIEDSAANIQDINVGANKTEVMQNKVLSFIRKNGPVARRKVLQGIWGLNAKWFKDIMETLSQADLIEEINIKTTSGRDLVGFRLKDESVE